MFQSAADEEALNRALAASRATYFEELEERRVREDLFGVDDDNRVVGTTFDERGQAIVIEDSQETIPADEPGGAGSSSSSSTVGPQRDLE